MPPLLDYTSDQFSLYHQMPKYVNLSPEAGGYCTHTNQAKCWICLRAICGSLPPPLMINNRKNICTYMLYTMFSQSLENDSFECAKKSVILLINDTFQSKHSYSSFPVTSSNRAHSDVLYLSLALVQNQVCPKRDGAYIKDNLLINKYFYGSPT